MADRLLYIFYQRALRPLRLQKINLKRQYTIDSPQGYAVALHFKKSL
nr:MAG TPA: hypothetical protein [Caudoviricetes sp.]